MKKRISFAVIGLVAAAVAFLLVNHEASARWFVWDDREVNPVRTCRDGIYLGLGTFDVVNPWTAVTARLESDGSRDILFTFEVAALPEQAIPHEGFTRYEYYTFLWEDGNRELAPGDQVSLNGFPVVTVEDCLVVPRVPPVSPAFSYQGTLSLDGRTANGAFDFRFYLWDASSGGNVVGGPIERRGTSVNDGLFNVALNFGPAAFTGRSRWLEMRVRPAGSTASYTTLSPRQPIMAVPYASSLVAGARISDTLHAPLLTVNNEDGDALHVTDAFNGIVVDSVRNVGLAVSSAGYQGIRVDGATTGIIAQTTSQYGSGVQAINTGGGNGIEGSSSGAGIGVEGSNSEEGVGVYGRSSTDNGYGVVGIQEFYGTYDQPPLYWKSAGFFAGGNGVIGVTKDEYGIGVLGYNRAPFSWAGQFNAGDGGNGVQISTETGRVGLTVYGGSKNAVVPTDEGDRLLYTEESTEVWFTDYGFGTLGDGVAFIAIDRIFRQTVNLDEPYHVFVQAYGDADLYVTNRTAEGFEVHVRDGDRNVEFSYRLVAQRLGFEGDRLELAPWADPTSGFSVDGAQPAGQPPQEGGER